LVGPAAGAGIFNADAATLELTGSTLTGNQALGGSNNTSTGGGSGSRAAFRGGLDKKRNGQITHCPFRNKETPGGAGSPGGGGSGNRGDGVNVQFVGTGTGGGIATSAGNLSGEPVSLTLSNVTLRHNRAAGGDGNTAGTFVDAGIGGGLWNNGRNPFALSKGSEGTLRDSTLAHKQAVGGHRGGPPGGGVGDILWGGRNISGSDVDPKRRGG